MTFITLQFVIKLFVLSIFEWPFYTSFTVEFLLVCCILLFLSFDDFYFDSLYFDFQTLIILNINNIYFDNTVSQIYPSELQLNKANTSNTEAAFLDLYLSISNDIVSTKINDKHDDFDFEIVNFPFLDGDFPHSTSYGVYQLIRYARASSYITDFITRN